MKHSCFVLSLYFENYQYGLSQFAVKLSTLETKKTKRSQCQHKNGNLRNILLFFLLYPVEILIFIALNLIAVNSQSADKDGV
jgi:hypothetical protein